MKRAGLIFLLVCLTIYGLSQKQINQYEYWFDNAYSSKSSTSITPSASYTLSMSIPTVGLPTGLHTFQLRFKDNSGVWSTPSAQFFVKPPVTMGVQSTITNYEYWFDNDASSKISQSVTANNSISLVSTINTGNLPTGLHTLQLRFKDKNGVWSTPVSQFFIKPPVTTGVQPTLTNYEYWFDNDASSKVSQSVTANNSISLVSTINTGNLPTGLHTFQARFKDSNGVWSATVSQFFVKPLVTSGAQSTITNYEYWFDNDASSKVSQSVTANNSISLVSTINTGNLPTGLHTFQARFKDSNGAWSTPVSQFFVKPPVTLGVQPTITNYEYWFDNNTVDKVTQAVIANNSISLVSTINTGNLPTGLHTFQARFKDSNGVWSAAVSQFFVKPEIISSGTNKISQYRYWFETGFDKRTTIDVNPINPLELKNLSIPISIIPKKTFNDYNLKIDSLNGNKIIYHPFKLFNIQFKDVTNKWSRVNIDTVRSNYEVNLKCDTLVSKVAKNILIPTSDTLHVYKTAALMGDSLYFSLKSVYLSTTLRFDIFDPRGIKIKSVVGYSVTAGLRATMDGVYYVVVHGFTSGYGNYTLNYTHIDRVLPDLHVSSVTAQNVVANTKTTVSWTVINDGTASTAANSWIDRIWLVKDITKDFSTTGILLKELQNAKSLAIAESYQNSAEITIPERFEGTYYIVVMSDMRDVYSINWTPTANVVPASYAPNVSGSPYPYLSATTNATHNKLLELNEKTNICDNFFFKKIAITLPPLPDLQVNVVQLPTQLIADRKAAISATITNKGTADIADKSWIDRIYLSKDQVFNKSNATVLASLKHSGGLKKDSSYVVNFQFTVPSDTLNQNRFFVETDALDSVFESNQDNNSIASNWVQPLPNTINDAEYQLLKNFYNSASGNDWTTKWKISSNRINSSNWYGVSFEEGSVKAISLPTNNIKGDFPITLFNLPKLKELNLYDNKLTERIDSTLANVVLLKSIKTDSLVSLNLGKNLLKIEIPSLVSTFPRLQSLNLANNMLGSIKAALPTHITSLNIQNQSIAIDSVKLSVMPELILPKICTYNHSGQSFDSHPSFSVLANGTNIGNLYYSGLSYHFFWNDPLGWAYKTGQPLVLRQENGLAAGTNASFSFTFSNGDANVDNSVDVLDVQHELNYILGDNPTPFNYYAANLYRDNFLSVQDIVSTINLVLSSDSVPKSVSKLGAQKIKESIDNTIELRNGKLILNLETPVSAMDISIANTKSNQVRMLLNNADFQMRAVDKTGYTRFILFSPTGAEIPIGETAIAEVQSQLPSIRSLLISNKQAVAVPINIKEETTAIGSIDSYTDNFIKISNNQIEFTLTKDYDNVSIAIYNTQGILSQVNEFGSLSVGGYKFDLNNNLPNGPYILKFKTTSGKVIINKNVKFIVAK